MYKIYQDRLDDTRYISIFTSFDISLDPKKQKVGKNALKNWRDECVFTNVKVKKKEFRGANDKYESFWNEVVAPWKRERERVRETLSKAGKFFDSSRKAAEEISEKFENNKSTRRKQV